MFFNMLISVLVLIIIFTILNLIFTYSTSSSCPLSMTPFECGFSSKGNSRKEFSVKFYIFGIIFLLFDAEIILLLPVLVNLNFLFYYWVLLYYFMIFLISISLYYEWLDGSLDW